MGETLLKLIEKNKFVLARRFLVEMNPMDIAAIIEDADEDKVILLFRILPKDLAADVFANLSSDLQRLIVESITDKEIKSIVDELFVDDTVDFLEEMPAVVVKKVLRNTKEDKRKIINSFLRYPEDSAGSLMTIEFVDLKKEMNVKAAIERIKKTGIDKETINTCYVIDKGRHLEGVVTIRKLILSDDDLAIKEIMDTNVKQIHTHDDQEKIAELFKKYDFLSMPVVDNENRLVGIITIDDVVDIIEIENTEDFQRIAAIEPSEEKYLKTKVFTLARKRFVWLLVLMISATLTQSIIEGYQGLLANIIILNAFIPMLMGTGGNAGAQASTLIIRSLALGEVELSDIFRVIWKEIRVGILIGVPLAFVNFVRLYFIGNNPFDISLVVCGSIIIILVLAKFVGGVLPILAKTCKIDPALMASPLITTILDACALLIYFNIASMFL